ncbi:MAG: HAD hydrolase-like protein [Patescibacteria group bacterium]|nr:HAD hydrolase-like protein [Patescibacteria group bacterium]
MKYKYGIFDLDGTIINTMPTYTKVFLEVLNRKFKLKINIEDSNKYYLNSAGTPLGVQFQQVLKNNHISFTNIEELVDEFFKIVNKKDFLMFEKAEIIIQHLHNKNISLFVSTGSETENSKKILKKFNLLECFSVILGSDKIIKGPDHIEEFAEFANLPIEEFTKQTFFCGDGVRDMEIAKTSGIYAIGIAQTIEKENLLEAGADVAVDKIGDILDVMT